MKKKFYISLFICSLVACEHQKRIKNSIPKPTRQKSESYVPHLENGQLIDQTITTPSKKQIIEWENEYPIFNGKSKGIDLMLANYKLKNTGNSITDKADELNDPSQSNISSNLDEHDGEEIKSRGAVNLKVQDFIGNSVPFTGSVTGNIKTLIVNNKKIAIEDSTDLFFRLKIDVDNGYNRIPVVVINKSGKSLKSYIEFNYPVE
jgi:hypothetical protein